MNRRAASRLTAYSAAAIAASSTAQADIIYSGLQNIGISQGFKQGVDLDGDFASDISLKNYILGAFNYQGAFVEAFPGKLVGFTAGPSSFKYGSNLSAGSLIDAAALAASPSFIGSLAYGVLNPNAQFNSATNAYIGLSFPSGADLYYGWVRVDINNTAGTFLIHDWAYNNTSNTGIAAGAGIAAVPEPSSLGLLALGAAGLGLYRRRQRA